MRWHAPRCVCVAGSGVLPEGVGPGIRPGSVSSLRSVGGALRDARLDGRVTDHLTPFTAVSHGGGV